MGDKSIRTFRLSRSSGKTVYDKLHARYYVKRIIMIASLIFIPLHAFAKYDHAMIDMYNTGQKNKETTMIGTGAAFYPVYTARTEQRLIYGFAKLDYLYGTKDVGGDKAMFETWSLLFGAEYQRRIGQTNLFTLIALGGGGVIMSAERAREKGPFSFPDGKRHYDRGPCGEASLGFMWAPITRWGFFLRCGWRQPVFVRHSGNKTRWGGPYTSFGVRVLIPGLGL
jgi:hypothetical protein